MAAQHSLVFGVFKTPSPADKAVSRLTSAGFSDSDVSLLTSNIDGLLSVLGIPEHESRLYEGYVEEGGVLLSVHCSNLLEIDRANTILEQNSAEGIYGTGAEAVSTNEIDKP